LERWAANTLRIIGMVLISLILSGASLLLLLLSICSWTGGLENKADRGLAFSYVLGLVCVLAVGIFLISYLSKGVVRSTSLQPGAPPFAVRSPRSDVPVHLSPASIEAIRNLSYGIGAAIALGVVLWGTTIYHLLAIRAPASSLERVHQPWLIVALIGAAIHYLPYVLLLFRLQRKPDRLALAFAMGIPAASLLQTLTSLQPLLRLVSYPQTWSRGLLPTLVAIAAQIAILYLAWRANQHLGYRQEPASLLVAAVAAYTYFLIFGSSNTWMYRFIR
jgi:hypothetical protein